MGGTWVRNDLGKAGPMQQNNASTDQSYEWLIERLSTDLDATTRVPLYEQLAGGIEQLIREHRLPPGSLLPREPDLARQLGLSRQTVNQALTGLAQRGLLIRRRGIGTFVAQQFVEQPLDTLYSFIRTLNAQGREPGTRMLGSRVTIDKSASHFLTGSADGLVHEISRLRLMDGEPIVIEEIFLPVECGGRLPAERLLTEVVYDLLRDYCDIDVTHAQESLQPITIGRTGAALLGIKPGDAVFLVERWGFAGAIPIELRRSRIRGDRYRFRVDLPGHALTRAELP